jgi:hypothetical protein
MVWRLALGVVGGITMNWPAAAGSRQLSWPRRCLVFILLEEDERFIVIG